MFHPNTPLQDPTQAYSQMLNLSAMQQSMAQRAQLAPLQQQEAQLQVQNLQNQQNIQTQTAAALQAANARYAMQQTPASGAAPSAVVPGAGPDDTPEDAATGRNVDTPPSAFAPPPNAAAPMSATTMQNSTGPGATPPPVAPKSLPDLISEEMNSRGMGAYAPKLIQETAAAKVAAIQAADAQRNDNDQAIGAQLWNKYNGDINLMQANAAQAGMSPQGIQQMGINLFNMAKARTALDKENTDNAIAKHTLNVDNAKDSAGRLTAFLGRPENDSDQGRAANWDGLLQGFLRDGLMTNDQMKATLQHYQQYPNGYPGGGEVAHLRNMYNMEGGVEAGAKAITAQDAANTAQTQQTMRALVAAAQVSPTQYWKVAQANGVDLSTLPAQFDPDGKPLPGAIDQLRKSGLSLEQQQVAQNAANTLAATTNFRNARLAQGATAEADRARAQSDKDATTSLANKYYSANGSDPDKAIAALNASTDPKEQPSKLQAIALLQQSKVQGLAPIKTQAQIDEANRANRGKGNKDAFNKLMGIPDVPPAAAGQGTQQPVIPAGEILVKLNADGTMGTIDPAKFDPKTMTKQ
jgi:hypothetical protein